MDTLQTALKRRPLKQEVFDVLHASILSGQYPAGSWLRQEEIAHRLGVSMTPVREALDLLVSSGLAERVAYRGVRVLHPTSPDVLDAYEMRLLLEGAAARMAAENISPAQLDVLYQLTETAGSLEQLADLPRTRELSRELHGAIVEASGNALLGRIHHDVLHAFPDWMLYEHLYRNPDLLAESLLSEKGEHQQIVEALAAHNPDAAEKRAIDHVIQRGRELERYLGIPGQAIKDREARVRGIFAGMMAAAPETKKETA